MSKLRLREGRDLRGPGWPLGVEARASPGTVASLLLSALPAGPDPWWSGRRHPQMVLASEAAGPTYLGVGGSFFADVVP